MTPIDPNTEPATPSEADITCAHDCAEIEQSHFIGLGQSEADDRKIHLSAKRIAQRVADETAEVRKAFDGQRESYIRLRDAVIGDGTAICEIDAVEVAEELRRDKARLDWLDNCEVIVSTAKEGVSILGHNRHLNPDCEPLRSTIDAARQPEQLPP